MSVDEMELVGRLKDAPPLRPEAYEHGRAVLRGAMADSRPDAGPVPSIQVPVRGGRRPRRTVITRGRAGVGIGIGVAAAAVAVALVVTSAPHPGASPGGPSAASAAPSTSATARPTTSKSSPPSVRVANPQLMSLAAVIAASGTPSGNATLVIRTQTNGGAPVVNYDLYADNGAYYYGTSPASLTQAVIAHHSQDEVMDTREVAAALYAATGDLATARVRMINASPSPFGLGLDPAKKKALARQLAKQNAALRAEGIQVSGPDTGRALQEDYDNYVWNNSVDALTKGAGRPQVRARVLRLLSTVPEVTVKDSTTDGQATLTLTAGKALLDDTARQVLTISATTGMPISSELNAPGQPPSAESTYQVSRVTLAGIAGGTL